jgi:hypothetical protein
MSAIRPRPDRSHNARSDYCTCRTCTRVRAAGTDRAPAMVTSPVCASCKMPEGSFVHNPRVANHAYVATKTTLLWCLLHNGPDTCNTPNTDDYGV